MADPRRVVYNYPSVWRDVEQGPLVMPNFQQQIEKLLRLSEVERYFVETMLCRAVMGSEALESQLRSDRAVERAVNLLSLLWNGYPIPRTLSGNEKQMVFHMDAHIYLVNQLVTQRKPIDFEILESAHYYIMGRRKEQIRFPTVGPDTHTQQDLDPVDSPKRLKGMLRVPRSDMTPYHGPDAPMGMILRYFLDSFNHHIAHYHKTWRRPDARQAEIQRTVLELALSLWMMVTFLEPFKLNNGRLGRALMQTTLLSFNMIAPLGDEIIDGGEAGDCTGPVDELQRQLHQERAVFLERLRGIDNGTLKVRMLWHDYPELKKLARDKIKQQEFRLDIKRRIDDEVKRSGTVVNVELQDGAEMARVEPEAEPEISKSDSEGSDADAEGEEIDEEEYGRRFPGAMGGGYQLVDGHGVVCESPMIGGLGAGPESMDMTSSLI